MKRRRLIALISFCTLAALGILAAVGGLIFVRTDMARNFVQARASAAVVNGSVYIGPISGSFFGGLTIDTIAVRDSSGEMVLSTGKVSAEYDVRDLMDTRIHLRNVVAQHPYLHLRQRSNRQRTWNYKELFEKKGPAPKRVGPARSWGSFVVVDSFRATDATYQLSLAWEPDSSLHGTKRDSVIRAELARKDRIVKRTPDGFARSYIWTKARGFITHARLADPDSNRFGQEVHIASLDANEFDPPFQFRNLRGVIRRMGDTAWLNIAHWDLPASTGSAVGKVIWGSDLPIRYDVQVKGDSVALADVNWVYPTLPKTGGGRMNLTITNKRNIRVMDYRISGMDVRSTGSHLTGEMTFGVGGPVLQLRNVDLKADPLDFDLIRTINGKAFPIDWRGQIFGDVRAAGGPLTNFEIDAARGEWRDTHVKGAVSRLSGSGELNILVPALTQFHDFDVDVGRLDLRSIQYLFPAFPKLNGEIMGRATLDSVWTDVRFRDADITHRDGPGTPSHFTGSGRITDGRPFITYNLDLLADPLSFEMLARSFPAIKLRGLARGPVSIRGQSPDLQINATLASAGGTIRYAGNIDIDSLGGFGARGRGDIANVNLAQLLLKPTAPVTSLNAQYTLNVRGSSASTLSGTAEFKLDSSKYDRITIDSLSLATIRFDQGRAFLSDSIRIRSPMGTVSVAAGALGLPGGVADSVNVTLTVNSLGQLRPFLLPDSASAKDSLNGRIVVNGVASGRLDSLNIRGLLSGLNLFVRGFDAAAMTGDFAIFDALRAPHGEVKAAFSQVTAAGLQFDTVRATIALADTAHGRFVVNGLNSFGDSLRLNGQGSWATLGGTTSVRIDGFDLAFAASKWALEQPSTVVFDSTMFRIDTVGLRNAKGGSVGLAGFVPSKGAVDLRVSGASVPLGDIDRVAGFLRAPLSGVADFSARITGTKDLPVIDASSSLDSIMISDVRIGRLLSTARYANNAATVSADIYQGPKRVFHGTAESLPLAIRFFGYDKLPGRVRVNATADSADFTLIQTLVKDISEVKGKVFGDFRLDGTWDKPQLVADARLAEGEMRIDTLGIKLTKMGGQVVFRNDTLLIPGLRAQSGGEANTGSLLGAVAFEKWKPSWFNIEMQMRDFQAYNRSELATVYARTDSGPVILKGSFDDDELTGVINVDRGAIYLPDPKLVGKRFSTALFPGDDSIGFAGRPTPRDTSLSLYELVTNNLNANLRVHLGGAFKLSADYADIPLSGDLRIVPVTQTDVTARTTKDFISKLAPVGVVNADRGTYTLDLFPVRTTFDVQRGGTVTFDRDAEWNGVLNVSARHVVRPFGRPEVPILVKVTDRLLTPKVSLESETSYPISQSDLISYIVVGEPGFAVLGQTSRTTGQTVGALSSSLFSPVATSFLSEQLKKNLRLTWIDQFRVEAGNISQTGTTVGYSQLIYGARLAAEKELFRNKVFVSVSGGLCGLQKEQRQTQGLGSSLSEQVGVNLDWRLQSRMNTGASWQVATEPSTQALFCSPGYSGSGGTAPTPRQYSLSFLKFWRW